MSKIIDNKNTTNIPFQFIRILESSNWILSSENPSNWKLCTPMETNASNTTVQSVFLKLKFSQMETFFLMLHFSYSIFAM
jgi:hypothetical protein